MEKCSVEENDNKIELLEFVLNDDNLSQRYAIEILHLKEVYSVKCVTPLPCTPSFIIGIVNFRGKIISVVDIRNFLGVTSSKMSTEMVNKVVVTKVDGTEVGIAADGILGCNEIMLSEIQKNILPITNVKTDYFKGITKERSIILDIKNIMRDDKIIINDEVI